MVKTICGDIAGAFSARTRSLACAGALAAAMAFAAPPAHAIVVYDVAGDGRNLSAPGGDEGWSSTGHYAHGGCVAISPHVVLTAQHLSFSAGSSLNLGGSNYTTVEKLNVPGSEMMLVRVAEAIPGSLIAPLYTGSDEVGKDVTMFGFGGAKGVSNPVGGADLTGKGWAWTADTASKSWGRNTIDGIDAIGANDIMYYAFDPVAGVNEGMYTPGDSGGGMFINDGGTWKVAGIAWAVTVFYADATAPDYLEAAIYDPSGLWYSDGVARFQATSTDRQLGVASRVSTHLEFITSAVNGFEGVPEPATLSLLAAGGAGLLLRRRQRV